jgi:hypothetical protein
MKANRRLFVVSGIIAVALVVIIQGIRIAVLVWKVELADGFKDFVYLPFFMGIPFGLFGIGGYIILEMLVLWALVFMTILAYNRNHIKA